MIKIDIEDLAKRFSYACIIVIFLMLYVALFIFLAKVIAGDSWVLQQYAYEIGLLVPIGHIVFTYIKAILKKIRERILG